MHIDDGVKQRFHKYSPNRPSDGCWLWAGACHPRGYGKLIIRNRVEAAHRVSWAIHQADPGDLCVLHRCDNPPCVNPEHLFLGTDLDNKKDMFSKRRGVNPRGERHGRTPFTEADVRAIRTRREAGESYGALGREYGVTRVAIRNICLKRSWSHVS